MNVMVFEEIFNEIFILAFPEEFSSIENSTSCKNSSIEIPPTLTPPHLSFEHVMSSHVTEKDCKLSCGSDKNCCGCMKDWNGTCKWNSVTNCEQRSETNTALKQGLSKKPGTIILYR